jgi:hypothetical protein
VFKKALSPSRKAGACAPKDVGQVGSGSRGSARHHPRLSGAHNRSTATPGVLACNTVGHRDAILTELARGVGRALRLPEHPAIVRWFDVAQRCRQWFHTAPPAYQAYAHKFRTRLTAGASGAPTTISPEAQYTAFAILLSVHTLCRLSSGSNLSVRKASGGATVGVQTTTHDDTHQRHTLPRRCDNRELRVSLYGFFCSPGGNGHVKPLLCHSVMQL